MKSSPPVRKLKAEAGSSHSPRASTLEKRSGGSPRRGRERAVEADVMDEDQVCMRMAVESLVEKLRAHLPFFVEDDAAVEPSTSLPVGMYASHIESSFRPAAESGGSPGAPLSGENAPDGKTASQSSFNSSGSTPTSSLNLLSPTQFSMAVGQLDASLLTRQKKVGLEALRLLRCGAEWCYGRYALTTGVSPPSSSPRTSSQTYQGGRSSQTLDALLNPQSPSSSSASSVIGFLFSAAFDREEGSDVLTSPSFLPILRLLVEAAELLLVYTNDGVGLRQHVASHEPTLLFLCALSGAVRQGSASERGVKRVGQTSFRRDLREELSVLRESWSTLGLSSEGRVQEELRGAYALEFLLDAALPPVVCSGKYEGLHLELLDRKQRAVGALMHSRQGVFGMVSSDVSSSSRREDGQSRSLMTAAPATKSALSSFYSCSTGLLPCPSPWGALPLASLVSLLRFSTAAEPKMRVRLLDKMVTDLLLMERLEAELFCVCHRLYQLGRGRGLSPAPQTTASSSTPPEDTARQAAVLRCISEAVSGCLDILLVLTSSDQASLWDGMAPPPLIGQPLRATEWVQREGPLKGIVAALLWLLSHAKECNCGKVPTAITAAVSRVCSASAESIVSVLAQLGGFDERLRAVVLLQLDRFWGSEPQMSAIRLTSPAPPPALPAPSSPLSSQLSCEPTSEPRRPAALPSAAVWGGESKAGKGSVAGFLPTGVVGGLISGDGGAFDASPYLPVLLHFIPCGSPTREDRERFCGWLHWMAKHVLLKTGLGMHCTEAPSSLPAAGIASSSLVRPPTSATGSPRRTAAGRGRSVSTSASFFVFPQSLSVVPLPSRGEIEELSAYLSFVIRLMDRHCITANSNEETREPLGLQWLLLSPGEWKEVKEEGLSTFCSSFSSCEQEGEVKGCSLHPFLMRMLGLSIRVVQLCARRAPLYYSQSATCVRLLSVLLEEVLPPKGEREQPSGLASVVQRWFSPDPSSSVEKTPVAGKHSRGRRSGSVGEAPPRTARKVEAARAVHDKPDPVDGLRLSAVTRRIMQRASSRSSPTKPIQVSPRSSPTRKAKPTVPKGIRTHSAAKKLADSFSEASDGEEEAIRTPRTSAAMEGQEDSPAPVTQTRLGPLQWFFKRW